MKHNVIPVTSSLKVADIDLPLTVYSDGSVDVKIPAELASILSHASVLNIVASLKCPAGLLGLRYFLDYAEENYTMLKLVLILPYIPNARQDRVNGKDGITNVFSLKSVTKFLKSSSIIKVLVTDPHSQVSEALIDKIEVMSQAVAFKRLQDRYDFEFDVVVSPDAGAIKKATEVSQLTSRPLVIATKKRNPINNEITGTEIIGGDIKGKHVVIVDDICDGGRTFIALAKILKEQGASKVTLSITHGIFSYGIEPLQEYIDEVYAYYNWLGSDYYNATYLKTAINV